MSAAFPSVPAAFARPPARPPSAGTSESLVLVGLILQVVGAAAMLIAVGWLIGFSLLSPYPYAGVVIVVVLAVAALTLGLLYVAYQLSYERIRRGEYAEAQGPTLVMGILSLFLGLIPGILYLVAYVKLGDALREQAGPAWPYGASAASPMGPASAQVACRGCGRVYPMGAFAFCPACGQKLGV